MKTSQTQQGALDEFLREGRSLDDAPDFALHALERELRARMAADNALLNRIRKALRKHARNGDKTSPQA